MEDIEVETGFLRDEMCDLHHHVEWNFEYWPDQGVSFRSPVFGIEHQTYYLKYVVRDGMFQIWLYRIGPALAHKAHCCVGTKHVNGFYHQDLERFTLDTQIPNTRWMKELTALQLPHWRLMNNHISPHRTLIVYFRATTTPLIPGLRRCHHVRNLADNPWAEGRFRRMDCPVHHHYEWRVGVKRFDPHYEFSSSRVFRIGEQSLMLVLRYEVDMTFCLYRMGFPPRFDPSEVQFWMGLKLGGENFEPLTKTFTLDPRENCEIWSKIQEIDIHYNALEKYVLEDCFTAFVLIDDTLQNEARAENCIQRDANLTIGKGTLREEVCPSHKLVEWTIEVAIDDKEYRHASPMFQFQNQYYSLMLQTLFFQTTNSIAVTLLRMGLSATNGTVHCWLKMPWEENFYLQKKETKAVNIRKTHSFWLKTNKFKLFHLSNRDMEYIRSVRFLPVLICVQDRKAGDGGSLCRHDEMLRCRPPPGIGNISEEICGTSKLMTWDVHLSHMTSENKLCFCPVFSIGNQNYVLGLSWKCEGEREIEIILIRQGQSVVDSNGRARWWLGLTRTCEHPYDDGGSATKTLSLAIPYVIWTLIETLCKVKIEGQKLTIRFLIGSRREFRVRKYTRGRTIRHDGDVMFGVCNAKFLANQKILQMRLHAFDVMFQPRNRDLSREIIEVPDCEVGIFEIFLNYVVTGKFKKASYDDMFDLYVISDKYLADYLTNECIRLISMNINPNARSVLSNVFQVYPTHELTPQLIQRLNELFYMRITVDYNNWLRLLDLNPAAAIDLLRKLL